MGILLAADGENLNKKYSERHYFKNLIMRLIMLSTAKKLKKKIFYEIKTKPKKT